MDEKEIEYRRLVIGYGRAKNDAERELADEKITEFERKNRKLVDEIQSRRWTAYGS